MSEPLAYRETFRTARKPWKCVECGTEIPVGTRYVERSGVWPEGPYRFRACASCHRWARGAFVLLGLTSYPIGQLARAIELSTMQPDGSCYVRREPRV